VYGRLVVVVIRTESVCHRGPRRFSVERLGKMLLLLIIVAVPSYMSCERSGCGPHFS
jgi:hypothetical protein